MSISPTDVHRSESSSSRRNPLPNPSSDHGIEGRRPLDRHQIGGDLSGNPSSLAAVAGSAPGSASGSLGEEVVEGSGANVAISGDSFDSSKNVVEYKNPNAREGPGDENSGSHSQRQATVRGGISSQFRSDQLGPQINGKSSGTGKFLNFDHQSSGSSGLQNTAAQSTSRRNQVVNANHLLNFYYDPISRPPTRAPPPRRPRKIKPYNKDLFLQANYKFVVLDTGSYQIELMDPDKMLQWEDVICLRYSAAYPVQCPVCLESPLCPQMTSCGHIYCFPCILRYLLMGEEDHKGDCWKKCPLCFMMISSKDLFTIQIEYVRQFHVGDRVEFTLLTRPKDSLVPSLKNQQGVGSATYSGDVVNDSFSKFTLTSDVELSVREAKSDLNNWLQKADMGLVDDLERLPYVCAALEQLEERMKNWMEHRAFSGSPPMRNSTSTSSNLKVAHMSDKLHLDALNTASNSISANSAALESGSKTHDNGLKLEKSESTEKVVCESSPTLIFSEHEAFGSPEKVSLSCDEDRAFPTNCKAARERDSYSFYQAIDGQHLILHPLNMKCLLHHYGSYDMLPPRISGTVLEMEIVTQSEAMRRRYRYLSHFSLTTTFQLCEIDLSEILPPSSLAPFKDEIKRREKQRKRLARKEEDEKARAEAAAFLERPIAYDLKHPSHNHTIFSLGDFEALGSAAVPSTSPPINNERKLFSDVTRLGYAAAHSSPSLKAEASTDSAGSLSNTGEASEAQGPKSMTMLSFANVMSAPRTAENPAAQNTNAVGKKGKKPTKILLSTAGGRRY